MPDSPASTEQDTRPVGPTPGPWHIETDSDVLDADHGPEVSWPWRIIGADGRCIVDFTGGNAVSDEDARLIAAAPDLLAALKGVAFRALKDLSPCWCPLSREAHPDLDHISWCQQARAAIAAAEGREPQP